MDAIGNVEVIASGRLHLGLLQLSRRYSVFNVGFGFAVEQPRWRVSITGLRDQPARCCSGFAEVEQQEAAQELLISLYRTFGGWATVSVVEQIPLHVGFGSKTALLCG